MKSSNLVQILDKAFAFPFTPMPSENHESISFFLAVNK